MKRLDGKVTIITGGGSGIGRATAILFAEEGSKIVVADAIPAGGEETVRTVRELGGEAIFVKADVSRVDDVRAMVEATVQTFGRLDCAVNNAGVTAPPTSIRRTTEESWDRIIAINLTGVFLCMKYEIPVMLKGGGGAIVNVASVTGLVGDGGHPAYAASKHGVVGLTKTVALQYADRNIRVNAVCPGVIRTPMIMNLIAEYPEVKPIMEGMSPMKRFGEAEEVGRVILFLCTPDASYINGIALPIDGGHVAR